MDYIGKYYGKKVMVVENMNEWREYANKTDENLWHIIQDESIILEKNFIVGKVDLINMCIEEIRPRPVEDVAPKRTNS